MELSGSDAFKLIGHKAKDILNEGLQHTRPISQVQAKALLSALNSKDSERDFTAEAIRQDPENGQAYAKGLFDLHRAAEALIEAHPKLEEVRAADLDELFKYITQYPATEVPLANLVNNLPDCIPVQKLACLQAYQNSKNRSVQRFEDEVPKYLVRTIVKRNPTGSQKAIQRLMNTSSLARIERERHQMYNLLENSRLSLNACFNAGSPGASKNKGKKNPPQPEGDL